MIPPWQRAHLGACAFVIAYALTYVAVDYLRLPRLVYVPHAHAFVVSASPPGPLQMAYVGTWLWALAIGLGVGLVTWAVVGRRRAPASSGALGLGTAWAITAVLIAGAYYTWHNWP